MAEELKIIIDAEVTGAVNGMKVLQGGIVKLNKTTLDFVSTLKGSFDPAVSKSFKTGALNVNQMKLALETLKENMRLTTDPQMLVKYNLAIKDIETNLKRAAVAGTQLGGAAGKAFSSLTQSAFSLARILPGIGIAGLIGLASDALINLASSFFKTNEAALKNSDIIKEVGDDYQKAVVSVSDLRINIGLAKDGFISKDAVVKEYNETIGKTTGFVKSLDEAEQQIAAKGDAYIKFTLLKASAQLALAKASQAALDQAIKDQKLTEDLIKATPKVQAKGKVTLSATDAGAGEFNEAQKRIFDEKKKVQALSDKRIKGFEDIARGFQMQAALLGKEFKFNFFGDGKLPKDQTDAIISRARQFVKEFGNAFIVPDLEESFFKTKKDILRESNKLLTDVAKFLENQPTLKIRLPIQVQTSQITETVTKDINELKKIIQSNGVAQIFVDVTTKGIEAVKKQLADIKDKTITISVQQLGKVSLDDLKDKEISISIKQEGDVKKIAEQLSKLKGVEVPIVIEKKGDVKEIVKELSALKGVDIPIKISKEGDIKEIVTELGKLKGVNINVTAKGIDLISKQLALLKASDIVIDVTALGINEVKKELSDIKNKTITVSVKQFGEVSLDELKDKEISISIKQDGDVKKIAEQLSKLKGVEVPIVIEKQGDVKEIIKELSSLKGVSIPIKINQEGDIKEIVKQLGSLKGVDINVTAKGVEDILKNLSLITEKEIEVKISQQGDVKKIAEQLTQLKGVEIPIVVEQKGNIEKIAEELTKLKGKTIPIKILEQGNIQEIVTQLKGLKDVEVNISAVQNVDDALRDVEKLIKGKEFPIIINEKGIIYQISRAIDGAIKVTKTKTIRVPIVTEADIKLAESLEKSFEPTQSLIDNFFAGLKLERGIPVEVIPDISLAKGSLDKIDKKLDLRKQFSQFGDLGLNIFNKIDFSNINKGIEEATKKLQNMLDLTNVLSQSIGQGLASAFDNVFDAVLQGKSVFRALGESVKALVIDVAKAVVKMLILKAVMKALTSGASGAGSLGNIVGGAIGGTANFGLGTSIGSRTFDNVISINVNGQISGDVIRLAGQRAASSAGRFG